MRLVISDAHDRRRSASAAVRHGTRWQRCRVPFLRNVLARVPRGAQATVRTIFQQPSHQAAREQLTHVALSLAKRFPKVADLLEQAAEEILTFSDCPAEHWRQIASTNPLARLNTELKRRGAVVGIFPNRAAVLRLFGALLTEQNDEWLVGRHYFSELSMRKLLRPTA